MQIIEYKNGGFEKSADGNFPCVLALGFFDGVHLAHRALLAAAKDMAKGLCLPLCVFTFFSEDSKIKSDTSRLYSTEKKLSLLSDCGVEAVYICHFSDISSMSGEDFISDIIIGQCSAEAAVCGFNFRFGKGALCDARFLKSSMEACGKGALIFEEFMFDGEPLSSSKIKSFLKEGQMEKAAKALGAPYFIEGSVSHGKGLGKKYGFPTVNLSYEETLLKNGVYAGYVFIDGVPYAALTNIGVCPTFEKRGKHAETYILNFNGDLYERRIRVYLLSFIREEKKFSSEAELSSQINKDKAYLGEVLEKEWKEFGLKLQ